MQRSLRAWATWLTGAIALVSVVTFVLGSVVVVAGRPGADQGLTARYQALARSRGVSFQRVDGILDFYWGHRAPVLGVPQDGFVAEWTGCLRVPEAERRLVLDTDGPVDIDIDGARWMSVPAERGIRRVVDDTVLPAGPRSVVVRYRHPGPAPGERGEPGADGAVARFRLGWQGPWGFVGTVPAHALSPDRCGEEEP